MQKSLIYFCVIFLLSSCGIGNNFSKRKYLNLGELDVVNEQLPNLQSDKCSSVFLDLDDSLHCDTISLINGKEFVCTILKIEDEEVRFDNCPKTGGEYILRMEQIQRISGGRFDRRKIDSLERSSREIEFNITIVEMDTDKKEDFERKKIDTQKGETQGSLHCDTIMLIGGQELVCTILKIENEEVRYDNCPKTGREYMLKMGQIERISVGELGEKINMQETATTVNQNEIQIDNPSSLETQKRKHNQMTKDGLILMFLSIVLTAICVLFAVLDAGSLAAYLLVSIAVLCVIPFLIGFGLLVLAAKNRKKSKNK